MFFTMANLATAQEEGVRKESGIGIWHKISKCRTAKDTFLAEVRIGVQLFSYPYAGRLELVLVLC